MQKEAKKQASYIALKLRNTIFSSKSAKLNAETTLRFKGVVRETK